MKRVPFAKDFQFFYVTYIKQEIMVILNDKWQFGAVPGGAL
jgi:hypothetical protein